MRQGTIRFVQRVEQRRAMRLGQFRSEGEQACGRTLEACEFRDGHTRTGVGCYVQLNLLRGREVIVVRRVDLVEELSRRGRRQMLLVNPEVQILPVTLKSQPLVRVTVCGEFQKVRIETHE